MEASFWNERYGRSGGYVFGTEPNGFLVDCNAHLPGGGRVLCLAEGEGRNAVHLAELGYRVTAVDQSEVGLEKARRLAEERGVGIEFVTADLNDMDLGDSCWDVVICIYAHLPPELRRRVHRGVVGALAPGGCVVLEAYHPRQVEFRTGGPVQWPEMLMTLEMLREDFDGLRVLVGREIEREVIEGEGHTGQAAVVQVLARKDG